MVVTFSARYSHLNLHDITWTFQESGEAIPLELWVRCGHKQKEERDGQQSRDNIMRSIFCYIS